MLCFAGEFSRAEKHLNLLSDASPDASIGALVYRSAVSAERKRQAFFESRASQHTPVINIPRPGRLNGERFYTIEDIDPRIGSRRPKFSSPENTLWLPFAHIGSLNMEAPRFLRDMLWSSAVVTGGPGMKQQDFGEVLLPILYPFSWQHERDEVKLGRETDWMMVGEEVYESTFGQKLLVLDGEKSVPFLDIRSLQFDDSLAVGSA